MSFLPFTQMNRIMKMTTMIPMRTQNGQISSVFSCHGTCTFIPKMPAMRPRGRKIVAIAANKLLELLRRLVKSFKVWSAWAWNVSVVLSSWNLIFLRMLSWSKIRS